MILPTSPHSLALAQLYPLDMDAEQNAVALEMDRIAISIQSVWKEIFPSTAEETFERWESLYELDGAGSDEDRRAALMAAFNADAGISQRHYEALALAMGHRVLIKPPKRMFRAGASHVGQCVYVHDDQWTWEVQIASPESDCASLVTTFEEQKIPFTVIRWVFNPATSIELDGSWLLDGSRILGG